MFRVLQPAGFWWRRPLVILCAVAVRRAAVKPGLNVN
jgi:hypothetical protein